MNRKFHREWEARVQKLFDRNRFALYFYRWDENGNAQVMTFVPKDLPNEQGVYRKPDSDENLAITSDDAQQLMDELWRAGCRPTEGMGSVGQLEAVQAHIKELQKINEKLTEWIDTEKKNHNAELQLFQTDIQMFKKLYESAAEEFKRLHWQYEDLQKSFEILEEQLIKEREKK